MEVALFRPTQRQAWVDRLRSSGYTIRFVHDPERLLPSTHVVIIDTAVAKWKDYSRLLKDKGIPILLLADAGSPMAVDDLTAAGIMGVLTTEEDIQECYFQNIGQQYDANEVVRETPGLVPSWQEAQSLDENEQLEQPDAWRAVDEKQVELQDSTPLGDNNPCEREGYVPLSRRKKQGQDPIPKDLASLEKVEEKRNVPRQEEGTSTRKMLDISWAQKQQQSGSQKIQASEAESQNEVVAEDIIPMPPVSLLPAADRRELPSMVTVHSPKGGVGKTVFLLHLAALLAMEKCRVCLLDLDMNQGTVAATLQLSSAKTILDLSRRIESPQASRACLLPTKMGFFIVAAPEQPTEITFPEEQLRSLFAFLKSEVDIVLVDTSSHLDNMTKAVMTESEVLLLMTIPDPASIAGLMRIRALLANLLPSPEMGVIWNRLIQGDHPQALPWPRLLELPEEANVAAAVRKGGVNLHGPYATAIQSLVRQWLGKELAVTTKGKRPWVRWLSRIP